MANKTLVSVLATGIGLFAVSALAQPIIRVTAPISGTVVRPNVQLDATCEADPPGCLDFKVFVSPREADVIATGTESIHASVAMTPWGDRTLVFQAVDGEARRTRVSRTVFLLPEADPLQELATVGELAGDDDFPRILDFDGTQVLYELRSMTNAYFLRDLRTSEEICIPSPDPRARCDGFLMPVGALFRCIVPGGDTTLYHWNGSDVMTIGARLDAIDSLRVSGAFAIWNVDSNLYVFDTRNGSVAQVTSDAYPNYGHGVASDGTVAYGTRAGQIFSYRDGKVVPITDGTHLDAFPRTDGTAYVFTRRIGEVNQFILWQDGVEEMLIGDAGNPWPSSPYEIRNGYVAFVERDTFHSEWLWRRIPDGMYERNPGTLGILAENGDVLTADGRLLFPLGGTAQWVASRDVRGLFANANWYWILGRSTFARSSN